MLDIIRSNSQSWFIKIAFGLIIVVFVFWGVGNFRTDIPSVIMEVNKEQILVEDFAARYQPFMANLTAQYPNLTAEEIKQIEPEARQQVLQTLVIESLLSQEAKKIGISVSPQELRAEIEKIPLFHNEDGKFDASKYTEVLKAQGLTPGFFENDVKRELLTHKFKNIVAAPAFIPEEQARSIFSYETQQRKLEAVLFKAENYMSNAKPSSEEISKFYEENKNGFELPATIDVKYLIIGGKSLAANEKIEKKAIEDFYNKNQNGFKREEQVKARHILILSPQDADKEADATAKTQIDEALKQIKDGKSFEEVAKEVSQDGTAENGGDLGFFARGQMVPPFEEAAFSLEPGQVSEPVRTQFGWHLIKVEEKKPEGIIPLEETEEDIKNLLALEAANAKVDDALDDVLIATINGKSLSEAGEKYNLKVEESGMQNAANLQQMLGLSPQDVASLFEAPKDKILETAFSTPLGKVVAQVTAKEDAKIQTLEQVKTDIENILTSEKATKLAQEAADKARATIVDNKIPADLQAQVILPQPISRTGISQGFAQNKELADAIFATESQDFLAKAYNVEEGYALVRMTGILPLELSFWDQIKGQLIPNLNQGMKEKQYATFINTLRESATIEILNPSILQPQAAAN